MTKLPNIGDLIFITSSRNIDIKKFKDTFGERGIFGKVIGISNNIFSATTGEKISPEITVRVYFKGEKRHYTTRKERISLV